MIEFGNGEFHFRLVEGWGHNLVDWEDSKSGLSRISGLSCDSQGRVYLLSRNERPVLIADRDGQLLESWDASLFDIPHGATVDADDNFYCVDSGGHMVYKFDRHGKLLFTLGRRGHPSDTGAEYKPMHEMPDYRTVKRGAGPFFAPTNLAVAPKSGDLYISDGYGNSRIHRFTKDGAYVESWGEPGVRPGQFHIPHGVLVGPNDVVYVADRDNKRIQLFDLTGHFLEQWTFTLYPSHLVLGPDGLLYVCESLETPAFDGSPAGFRILTLEGKELAFFDNGIAGRAYQKTRAAHDICVDSEGSVYIGDVGNVPKDHVGVWKYKRV